MIDSMKALKTMNEKKQSSAFGFNDLMVIAAFRYCCGRKSYIVGVCADWLIEQWPNISGNAKAVIQRDLEEDFKRDDDARAVEARGHSLPLGNDCDRRDWERVRNLWANRRNNRLPEGSPVD